MPIVTDYQQFIDELATKALLKFGRRLVEAPSVQERVRCLIKHVIIIRELNKCLDGLEKEKRFSKSPEKSTDLRKRGNTLVKEGEVEGSIFTYSAALSVAPPGSQEYHLALVNRSVALFLFKLYKECIEDIDQVLDKEKNPEKKAQLLKRRSKSLEKLVGLEVEKTLSLQVHEVLGDGSLKGNKKMTDKAEAALDSLFISRKSKGLQDEAKAPSVSYGPNRMFPDASAGVTLKSNEEQGRYVVTNRNIKQGDTLFVERPAVFALDSACGRSRCGHCFKDLLIGVPCLGCSAICFCSNTCRLEAVEEYHSLECGTGMDLCFSLGWSFIAFRLGVMSIKENPKFRLIEGLNAHTEHLDPRVLTQHCITALLLALHLKRVSKTEMSLEQLAIDLTKHIARMLCNAFAISSVAEGSKKNVKNMNVIGRINVGVGMFPSVSMLNHSCDPNVMFCFSGAQIVVKAIRDIKKGDEVFNTYVPTYQMRGYEFRQKSLLEKYNFICKCTACTSPDLKNFAHTFFAFLCPKCSDPMEYFSEGDYVCACSNKISKKDSNVIVKDLSQVVYNSERLAEKPAEFLELVLETLQRAKKILYKYHPLLVQLKYTAAKLYALIGKFEESMDLIIDSFEATRARYGEESIESVFEYKKLLEVYTLAMFKVYPLSSEYKQLAEYYLNLAQRLIRTLTEPTSSMYKEFDSFRYCQRP